MLQDFMHSCQQSFQTKRRLVCYSLQLALESLYSSCCLPLARQILASPAQFMHSTVGTDRSITKNESKNTLGCLDLLHFLQLLPLSARPRSRLIYRHDQQQKRHNSLRSAQHEVTTDSSPRITAKAPCLHACICCTFFQLVPTQHYCHHRSQNHHMSQRIHRAEWQQKHAGAWICRQSSVLLPVHPAVLCVSTVTVFPLCSPISTVTDMLNRDPTLSATFGHRNFRA